MGKKLVSKEVDDQWSRWPPSERKQCFLSLLSDRGMLSLCKMLSHISWTQAAVGEEVGFDSRNSAAYTRRRLPQQIDSCSGKILISWQSRASLLWRVFPGHCWELEVYYQSPKRSRSDFSLISTMTLFCRLWGYFFDSLTRMVLIIMKHNPSSSFTIDSFIFFGSNRLEKCLYLLTIIHSVCLSHFLKRKMWDSCFFTYLKLFHAFDCFSSLHFSILSLPRIDVHCPFQLKFC